MVSIWTNLLLNFSGINFTEPYIKAPIKKAEMVVPIMANVKMAPKLRKKYFYKSIVLDVSVFWFEYLLPVLMSIQHGKWWVAK